MLPENLTGWERGLAWTLQMLLFPGGLLLCYWIFRKMRQAYMEGLRGDEEGKR
jgi:hypothetical protein